MLYRSVPSGPRRAPRRSERGSVLVISLLLLLVIAFLGSLILLMAQTESGLDTSMRSASLAFQGAEYALNRAINQLDIRNLPGSTLSTVDVPGVSGVKGWGGHKNGTAEPPKRLRQAGCAPGNDLSFNCGLYVVVASGQSTRFFVVTSRAEIEEGVSIFDDSAPWNF